MVTYTGTFVESLLLHGSRETYRHCRGHNKTLGQVYDRDSRTSRESREITGHGSCPGPSHSRVVYKRPTESRCMRLPSEVNPET